MAAYSPSTPVTRSPASTQSNIEMEFKIHEEKTVYNGHFKIKEAKVTHDTFSGHRLQVTRQCFERGNSAAAVIYESDSNSLLFTRQFRYPTVKACNGWIVELVAGSIDESDENPEDCIRREIFEELGYNVQSTEKITTFFTSPGGSSEQVHLYYAEVTSADRTIRGGGVSSEKEDIELVRIPADRIELGEFSDAKTLLGLQWFLLRKQSKRRE